MTRCRIGAHQDSKNYHEPLARAPGADDDGSGTVTILAAFRALVRAGVRPGVPVEFHWYAAEEGGMLGSREVARAYYEQGVPVAAMTQVSALSSHAWNVGELSEPAVRHDCLGEERQVQSGHMGRLVD
jgi:Zn-dependent M28 family amino/carboxypeptidase